MQEEIIVRLKITSMEYTPEMLSELLGIVCDRSWHIGDKRQNTIIEEKVHGWILNSILPKTTQLEHQIDDILNMLSFCEDKIRLVSNHSNVELSCVIYAETQPALNFQKRIIDALSRMGAGLDVDLYTIS